MHSENTSTVAQKHQTTVDEVCQLQRRTRHIYATPHQHKMNTKFIVVISIVVYKDIVQEGRTSS